MMDAGADYIHLDVMDGYKNFRHYIFFLVRFCRHFVPNITFGATMVHWLRKRLPGVFFGRENICCTRSDQQILLQICI